MALQLEDEAKVQARRTPPNRPVDPYDAWNWPRCFTRAEDDDLQRFFSEDPANELPPRSVCRDIAGQLNSTWEQVEVRHP